MSNTPIIPYGTSAPDTVPGRDPVPAPSAPHDRIIWVSSIAVAALLFLLLANTHWVPAGDSEVYVATARNVLINHFSLHGFKFNGQPINMVPPGWPYVLAAAMKISTSFLFLKLIAMVSMLGSLTLAYPICRRFAPPMICGAAVVLTALLSHVYPLTFWLHSDALFCLLTTASFLVAIQIGEGRAQAWRIALLCLLCAAAVTVRWAGLLGWIVVAGAVMDGRGDPVDRRWLTSLYWRELFSRANLWFGNPKFNRFVIAMLLSGLTTVGSFTLWRVALRVSEREQKAIELAGGADEGKEARGDNWTQSGYTLFNANEGGWRGYIGRTIGWGDWYSNLFWQPFRFHVIGVLNTVGRIAGWLVLAPLLILTVHGLYTRRWIWGSLSLYSFLLAMSWPHSVSRYLVPIVFLLFIGIWAGTQLVVQSIPKTGWAARTAMLLFLISFILCNGTLYGIEVWAQRSHDFYGTYEAGLNKDLIAASYWLNAHHLGRKDGIAVSERYLNLSIRARTSKLGLRVTTMLTGRPIMTIPKRYVKNPATTQPTSGPSDQPLPPPPPDFMFDPDPMNNKDFLAWARDPRVNVKYYLYQPAVSPWRALHFRVGWLQEKATHMPAIDTGAGWRLYEIPPTGDSAIRILPLPDVGDWPTHVTRVTVKSE